MGVESWKYEYESVLYEYELYIGKNTRGKLRVSYSRVGVLPCSPWSPTIRNLLSTQNV